MAAVQQRETSARAVVMAPEMNPVQKIQALMEAERPQEPVKEPEAPAETQAPEAEVEAPVETNQQVEGKEPEPDAATEEIPLERLEAIPLEVTVKGEDGVDVVEKPTVKELREGYMRQKDYSRKTAEVARQREAVSEEIRKGVEGERAAMFQQLQSLSDVVSSAIDTELRSVNWSDLAANDPAKYVLLDNRRKELDRVLNETRSKQQELIQKREAERAQARTEQARKSVELLEKKIPGWSDSLYQTLMKTAQDYGYKPDEVGSWVDHKAFEVLHDAHQYRLLKQKQPEKPVVDKRVVNVPKVIKPGAAAPNANQTRAGEAMKQLQKSGRIEDAAAVIKSRMG